MCGMKARSKVILINFSWLFVVEFADPPRIPFDDTSKKMRKKKVSGKREQTTNKWIKGKWKRDVIEQLSAPEWRAQTSL